MNSGMNDMDQWLQQSAEMGNAPFNATDWQHMKELLQPRKKRRFILFWWLFGLLVGCGIGSYLLMGANESKHKNIAVVKSKKQNSKRIETKETVHEKKETLDKLEESNKSYDERSSNNELKGNTTNNKDDDNRKEGMELSTRKTGIATTKKASKPSVNKLIVNNKTSFFAVKGKTKKTSTSTADALKFGNDTTTTIVQDSIITNNLLLFQQKSKQGELARVMLNIPAIKNKFIDSIANLQLPKDSATKKEQQQKKNEWLISTGYYTGNAPLQSKGYNLKFGYSIKLGSFFIQPSLAASTFNPTEQQIHNSTTIRPSSGTTVTEVKTITTNYTPSNGFVLQPSLSIGLSMKKVKLYAGIQQNMVLNANNKTNNVLRDSMYYTILPAGIKNTQAYDASLFNGKKSLILNIGIRYYVGKRWFANVEYGHLLDYRTVEGVIDEKKKRSALSLHIGIMF